MEPPPPPVCVQSVIEYAEPPTVEDSQRSITVRSHFDHSSITLDGEITDVIENSPDREPLPEVDHTQYTDRGGEGVDPTQLSHTEPGGVEKEETLVENSENEVVPPSGTNLLDNPMWKNPLVVGDMVIYNRDDRECVRLYNKGVFPIVRIEGNYAYFLGPDGKEVGFLYWALTKVRIEGDYAYFRGFDGKEVRFLYWTLTKVEEKN